MFTISTLGCVGNSQIFGLQSVCQAAEQYKRPLAAALLESSESSAASLMDDLDPERQLAAEQQIKYQGTAIVELEHISFDPLIDQEVDQRNVERLSKIFLQNGCQRLNVRNHVTATIPRRFLDRVRHAAGLTLDQLRSLRQSPPRLDFSGTEVKCLHGKHRLKAAAEVLPHSDRWWTVDLYLDGLNAASDLLHAFLIVAFRYQFGSEKRPCRGVWE